MLLLSPFYVAGWLAAGVVVVWRHVRAAAVTGWEDVAGPLPSAERSTRAAEHEQARSPRPPDAKPDRVLWKVAAGLLLALLWVLGLLLWVGFIRLVANG